MLWVGSLQHSGRDLAENVHAELVLVLDAQAGEPVAHRAALGERLLGRVVVGLELVRSGTHGVHVERIVDLLRSKSAAADLRLFNHVIEDIPFAG